jgi:flagellar hook-associated protein 2
MSTIEQTSSQSSQLIKTLDMGSGVDIQALAKGLADAENSARIKAVTARKESVENSISGYAIASLFLGDIKDGFDLLKNASSLFNLSASSSAPAQVSASVTGTPTPGQYTVEVQQLATSKTISSSSFAGTDIPLNGGVAFTVNLTIGSAEAQAVAVTEDTPEGLVSAINKAGLGVTASLINRSAAGDDWYVVLKGQSGASNTFSVSTDSLIDTGFADIDNVLTDAQNAIISVNGLNAISRSTNLISDVIPGLSLDLRSITDNPVRITVDQGFDPLKAALDQLVNSYNQFNIVMDELAKAPTKGSDPNTGSLNRDRQLVFSLKSQIRALFSQTSSTASGEFTSLRSLGLNFKLDGTAELDNSILNKALASDPAAVSMMLSGGTDNMSDFAVAKGLAQDVSVALKAMLGSGGAIQQREVAAVRKAAGYERELEVLATRLDATYRRYIIQFAAMESIVEKSKGIGEYLKGQFTAMENMYRT